MSAAAERDDPANNANDAGRALQSSRTITVVGERISSRELFATGRQITIEHGTEMYFLRLTAQNKLILTK